MLMRKTALLLCLLFSIVMLSSCTSHQVEVKPIEIKPIHITIDINVKIDKDLDDFFGELDEIEDN
ncbi:MAG: YnbE family lipoprotein [Desulfotalea sp.]